LRAGDGSVFSKNILLKIGNQHTLSFMGFRIRDLPAFASGEIRADFVLRTIVRFGKGAHRFFLIVLKARNPLKSLVSDERFQENPSKSKALVSAKAQQERCSPRHSKFRGPAADRRSSKAAFQYVRT
jgi:hypothetical protein